MRTPIYRWMMRFNGEKYVMDRQYLHIKKYGFFWKFKNK